VACPGEIASLTSHLHSSALSGAGWNSSPHCQQLSTSPTSSGSYSVTNQMYVPEARVKVRIVAAEIAPKLTFAKVDVAPVVFISLQQHLLDRAIVGINEQCFDQRRRRCCGF
jgi:hypothetical protein